MTKLFGLTLVFRTVLFLSIISLMTNCTEREKASQLEPGVNLELADFRKKNISEITYDLQFQIPSKQKDSIPAKRTYIKSDKAKK